ncbi:hypothetical protein TYRP_007270 [Tyrophagus putrescentiae]|nr:hypothetical protein TYRP_007270 [Tyrophagus putrescentiae]
MTSTNASVSGSSTTTTTTTNSISDEDPTNKSAFEVLQQHPLNNEHTHLLNSSSHLSSLDAAPSEPPNDTDTSCQQQKAPLFSVSTVAAAAAAPSTKDEAIPKDSWLILGGLKADQRFEEKPIRFSGYMLKRRKRPLKGWHKRFFQLSEGILSYAKSASDISKGKTRGVIDVGQTVISTKASSRRIDIDSGSDIFHLKVKKPDNFNQWVLALKNHRLARQHEMTYGTCLSSTDNNNPTTVCDNGLNTNRLTFFKNTTNKEISSSELSVSKFSEIDIQDDLFRLQEKLIKLSSLVKVIEVKHSSVTTVTDLEGFKYKKPRRRFHLRKKKSNAGSSKSMDQGVELQQHPLKDDQLSLRSENYLSLSHPSLAEEDPSSGATSSSVGHVDSELNPKPLSKTEAMTEFIALANEVNNTYRELLKSFQEEQQQRTARKELPFVGNQNNNNAATATSSSALEDDWPTKRGSMMNNRNSSIDEYDEPTFHQNVSRYSQDDTSVLSMSEYYDAEDKMVPSDYNSSTSEEEEEEDDDESVITDFSEDGQSGGGSGGGGSQVVAKTADGDHHFASTGRRTKLPSVQPSSDISLWSLLTKNIGKDLSKISMPVTINEPLNVLQRLCEELEYCELLDMACTVEDPCQRMLIMAAFAVSAYSSSSYRAGHKPFNPLLGETYECDREDKGFRFVSEQVSHHPPISACHADAKNYVFWQDLRVKSKFWGKSMEVIPFATVNVILKPFNCHYKWNKITTCVHNLFKGERYVDNYGELVISDTANGLTCKITFEKAGYWSNKKNEITGTVTVGKGEVLEKIFGRWNESIHCGTPPATRLLWRPGTMPDNFQDYYGFSRFAIELNELTERDKVTLPPTDTRFRPDQRLLEEGKTASAETVKLDLERAQRERRRLNEAKGTGDPEYTPLWFRKETSNNNEETYVYNGKYWEAKENNFAGIEFVELW